MWLNIKEIYKLRMTINFLTQADFPVTFSDIILKIRIKYDKNQLVRKNLVFLDG